MTLIQRFGSAANLNIHLHCLVLDGLYQCGAGGAAEFVEAPAPTDEQVHPSSTPNADSEPFSCRALNEINNLAVRGEIVVVAI